MDKEMRNKYDFSYTFTPSNSLPKNVISVYTYQELEMMLSLSDTQQILFSNFFIQDVIE